MRWWIATGEDKVCAIAREFNCRFTTNTIVGARDDDPFALDALEVFFGEGLGGTIGAFLVLGHDPGERRFFDPEGRLVGNGVDICNGHFVYCRGSKDLLDG